MAPPTDLPPGDRPPAPAAPRLATPPAAAAPARTPSRTPSRTPAGEKPRLLSREQLLDSLRAMRRQPQAIEVQTAMCYRMAAPPTHVDFECTACGHHSPLPMNPSDPRPPAAATGSGPAAHPAIPAGQLARRLGALAEGFRRLDPGAVLDARGLCPRCNPKEPTRLEATYPCAGCGKSLALTIADQATVDRCAWLFLDHPVQRLDGNRLNLWQNQEAGIASGALWIYEHRFCPACRAKTPLEP